MMTINPNRMSRISPWCGASNHQKTFLMRKHQSSIHQMNSSFISMSMILHASSRFLCTHTNTNNNTTKNNQHGQDNDDHSVEFIRKGDKTYVKNNKDNNSAKSSQSTMNEHASEVDDHSFFPSSNSILGSGT